jgi:hypothetical protein
MYELKLVPFQGIPHPTHRSATPADEDRPPGGPGRRDGWATRPCKTVARLRLNKSASPCMDIPSVIKTLENKSFALRTLRTFCTLVRR